MTTEEQLGRMEAMLRGFLPDEFRVSYDPDFPRSSGVSAKWFQVVFALGPGNNSTLRSQVHLLFEHVLKELSALSIVREADLVSLRARRRCPESKIYNPDQPFMFIEADWTGNSVEEMRQNTNFTSLFAKCLFYRNLFDQSDPLSKNGMKKPFRREVVNFTWNASQS